MPKAGETHNFIRVRQRAEIGTRERPTPSASSTRGPRPAPKRAVTATSTIHRWEEEETTTDSSIPNPTSLPIVPCEIPTGARNVPPNSSNSPTSVPATTLDCAIASCCIRSRPFTSLTSDADSRPSFTDRYSCRNSTSLRWHRRCSA